MEDLLNFIVLDFYAPLDFVAQHNHSNYCEALILPNGKIAYIKTSHQNCLLKLYMDKFNIDYRTAIAQTSEYMVNFLEHLHGELQVVSVWYEMVMYANSLTESQKKSLETLIKGKVLSSNLRYRRLNYQSNEGDK